MLFHIVGAGPSGLYLAYLLKRSDPTRTVKVFEQNRADVTFGFGVVLSGRALQFLAEGSAEVVDRFKTKMERWSDQHIVHQGEQVVIDGSSFSAIERLTLLRELQAMCDEVGVEMVFEHRAQRASDVAECDVLVGADGANSAVRESHADGFGTRVADFGNYFSWYGVERPFAAHTLTFEPLPGGAIVAHHYRYKPNMSTFVAEIETGAWDAAGMAEMSDDERKAFTEQVFARTLGGKPLVSNRSIWRRWRRVTNDHWHFKNMVLIGDALRTAHFSIGSGTRLAMEDAIALWRAFETDRGDIGGALQRYEATRKPIRDKLNTAMELSTLWYEKIGGKMELSAYDFVYDYLLRTNIMTVERLEKESPKFMQLYRSRR